MKILYGTGNPAKLSAMQRRLAGLNIEVIGLKDIDMDIPDIVEDGKTPLENARKKAIGYYEAFHMPVFSCDSGLYIDDIPREDQPGVHVRTINGKCLSDDEMLLHYSGLARKYGDLKARYRNAICLVMDEERIYEAMEESMASEPFIITDKQHAIGIKKKGFPLDSLSIDIKTGKYYYDLEEDELNKVAVEDGFLEFFKKVLDKAWEKDMDIAVFSDIHGNYEAFATCLEYAIGRGIDTFLMLGDYVAELPYPERTMKMLYDMKEKYNCTFIRGNKEDYWIDYRKEPNPDWKDNDSTTGMLFYTYERLSDADIYFFESMPIKQRVELEGYEPFMICHGSPYKTNEKMIFGTDSIREIMDESEEKLIICGHTHKQGKEEHNGKVVLNTGALGMALGSEGKAQFLILHGNNGKWQEEFVNLEYDAEKMIADMYEDDLFYHAPYWSYVTERLLKDGKISHGSVLGRAMGLCKADTGECIWPYVPEKYWEQAAKEMFK